MSSNLNISAEKNYANDLPGIFLVLSYARCVAQYTFPFSNLHRKGRIVTSRSEQFHTEISLNGCILDLANRAFCFSGM